MTQEERLLRVATVRMQAAEADAERLRSERDALRERVRELGAKGREDELDIGELYGFLREVLTLLSPEIVTVEIGKALLKRVSDRAAAQPSPAQGVAPAGGKEGQAPAQGRGQEDLLGRLLFNAKLRAKLREELGWTNGDYDDLCHQICAALKGADGER